MGERLRANTALVWFLTAVDSYVRVEAADVRECFKANFTLEGFVLGVRSNVFGQVAGENERAVALSALEDT